jgi:multisubunit Na+/H+ antiporter MnhB subunit
VLFGAAGIAVAFGCAALFNVLRFGTVQNTNYLQSEFRTPLDRIFEFAVGLVVAPNGGILVFWASATVLIAVMVVLPFAHRVPRSEERFDRGVALALAAIVIGLTFGLAAWYSPFGWVAWGPRLSLPWVLPLVLLGLAAFGKPLGVLTGQVLARGWRLLLIGAALVAVTLPQVGYMWRRETVDEFFALSLKSERCTAAGPFGSPDYYACIHERMWLRRSIVNDALAGLREPGGAFTAIVVAAGLLGCLALLREGLRSRGDVSGEVVSKQVDGQGTEPV